MRKKLYSIMLMFSIMLILCNVQAYASDKLVKIFGKDRIEASINASKCAWNKSYFTILASSEDYADALTAIPLSRRLDAPIILIDNNGLNGAIEEEIKRLDCGKVILIGGTGAISEETEEKLKKITEVDRICGNDRYETSVKIAEYMGNNKSIILTTGNNYADSLSIGPVAGQANMPILLVKQDEVSERAADYIKNSKPTKIVIAGGEGAVSSKIQEMFPYAERISGQNRYETNRAIIERFYQSFNFNNVCLVKDGDFGDILLASMVGAKMSAPMVMVNESMKGLNEDLIKKINPSTKFYLFGNENEILQNVKDGIKLNYIKLDAKGEEYSKEHINSDNVFINADDVKLKEAKINGNLYIQGNDVSLNEAWIKGDSICNLEKDQSLNINKSRLYTLKIENENNNTINFKDSEANNVILEGLEEGFAKLVGSSNFRILSCIVKGNAIFDNQKGDFGNITILNDGLKDKIIELKGDYDKAIYIQGNTTIKIDPKAKVSKLRLVTNNESSKVVIEGNVDIVTFINSGCVELGKNSHVRRMEAVIGSSGTVNMPDGAVIEEATSNITTNYNGNSPLTTVEPKALPTD